MMKAEDIRDMKDDDIRERIEELKEEQFRLRFRGATMQLENPQLTKTIRRDIARLMTILHERELAEQQS
ncbi:50S ribosomal protein L29 [Gemmatimonadota bacterium]